MAKIDVKCQECGHEARVPEAFRGKKVRCLRCRAKLRVPGEAPAGFEDSASQKSRGSRETKPPANRESRPAPQTAGSPSAKTRREVQQSIREILGDYEHAIENSPRGFVVDLRGVAFGLARTLVEDLIASPGVRDAKLAGGTGECRITITLEGAAYDPDDSFADDDDETEIFRRPSPADLRSPLEPSEAEAHEKPASSEVERLLGEGRDLVAQGDMQSAIDVLEKAVRVDRDHDEAVSTLAQAYARAGDSERARRAFKHLTQLHPDDADAHIYFAAAAMDCDRLDDARDALSAAMKLAPENARAYRYAAKLYEKTGDLERAKKFRSKYEQLKGR